VLTDKHVGISEDYPAGLAAMLDYARPGDTVRVSQGRASLPMPSTSHPRLQAGTADPTVTPRATPRDLRPLG